MAHWLHVLCLLLSLVVTVLSVTCSWTDFANTAGNEADSTQQPGAFNTLAACKAKCDDEVDGCLAVEYANPFCKTFTSDTTTSTALSTTFSKKSCNVVTTPTVATTTTDTTTIVATTTTAGTTADPGGASGQCTTTEMPNKQATSNDMVTVAEWSQESCKEVCRQVTQCVSVTWFNSLCTLHTITPTTTASTGSSFVSRTTCADGQNCCFESTQDNTFGNSSSSLTFQLTLEHCRTMCVELTSCVALTFSSGSCNLYFSTVLTSDATGSSYYTKTCSGSSTGSLTLDTTCQSSSPQLFTSYTVLAWLVFISSSLM